MLAPRVSNLTRSRNGDFTAAVLLSGETTSTFGPGKAPRSVNGLSGSCASSLLISIFASTGPVRTKAMIQIARPFIIVRPPRPPEIAPYGSPAQLTFVAPRVRRGVGRFTG